MLEASPSAALVVSEVDSSPVVTTLIQQLSFAAVMRRTKAEGASTHNIVAFVCPWGISDSLSSAHRQSEGRQVTVVDMDA